MDFSLIPFIWYQALFLIFFEFKFIDLFIVS